MLLVKIKWIHYNIVKKQIQFYSTHDIKRMIKCWNNINYKGPGRGKFWSMIQPFLKFWSVIQPSEILIHRFEILIFDPGFLKFWYRNSKILIQSHLKFWYLIHLILKFWSKYWTPPSRALLAGQVNTVNLVGPSWSRTSAHILITNAAILHFLKWSNWPSVWSACRRYVGYCQMF